jgi:peptidoglycan/LPS O-acetylase OafA/YrhL
VATIDLTARPSAGSGSGAAAGQRESATTRRRWTGHRGFGYIPGLDGIRAIAVLAVLLYHADVPWMPGGFLGVDMFFVLSGFLITSIVLTELDKTGRLDFKRFYLRRARRLLPALLLTLAFAAVLAAFLATDAAATVRRDIVGSLFYVTNWVYVVADQSYFEITGRPPLLQHLWSLAVEEQFYLVWPAVAAFAWRGGGRHRVREWALIGALGSTLIMIVVSLMSGYPEPNDASRVYFGTDAHAMGLLLGAALAAVWLPQRVKADLAAGARAIVNVAGFGALALVLLIMMNTQSNSAWLYRGGFLVFAAIMVVVIAAASHPASLLGRALSVQPLRYIGERSYGLYLWHWPVFLVLRPGLDVPLEGMSNLVLRFAVTFGLAELSYRFVEMPVRNGAIGAWWKRVRATPKAERRPIIKQTAIIAAAGLIVASLVGFRLVSIQEDPGEDYLHGLTEVSALTPGAAAVPADPTAGNLSNTIVAPGATTVRPGTLAIGESVMLGAQGGLRETFKNISIDAAVGRQAGDIVARLRALRDAGALRRTVILHTGTNGVIEPNQIDEMLTTLAGVDRIVVVNVDVPRPWQDENNRLLAEAVARTPNAILADWHEYAADTPGLLVRDGIHLTEQGVAQYSGVIDAAVAQITAAQAAAAAAAPPAATEGQ